MWRHLAQPWARCSCLANILSFSHWVYLYTYPHTHTGGRLTWFLMPVALRNSFRKDLLTKESALTKYKKYIADDLLPVRGMPVLHSAIGLFCWRKEGRLPLRSSCEVLCDGGGGMMLLTVLLGVWVRTAKRDWWEGCQSNNARGYSDVGQLRGQLALCAANPVTILYAFPPHFPCYPCFPWTPHLAYWVRFEHLGWSCWASSWKEPGTANRGRWPQLCLGFSLC